jgi:23S rRNA (cytosine1962-C5)-methyltransferase
MKEFELLQPRLSDYELIDSGDGAKLERFGDRIVARPEPQALWRRSLPADEWLRLADATFQRLGRSDTAGSGDERGRWQLKPGASAGAEGRQSNGEEGLEQWTMRYDHGSMHLCMRLALTGFKHVGVFPEQAANWDFIYDTLLDNGGGAAGAKVLNLFAYTGGATLAARSAGADVTHVDSVRQAVGWARDNAELSGLSGVRWIVDDALKFVRREVRRGNLYDGIVLDPPAYGRGPDGEKWVLEQGLDEMLALCAALLKPKGFLVLNLYSMGLSALVARTAVHGHFGVPPREQFGELYFCDRAGKQLPLGVFYRFVR